ncbi:hypothetical protein SAY86_023630 [Trapa natans]|uniref:Uncharacterized protein n=1 Tax=Trapa natans TaxID=22666 RepID=A0AAN7MB13_TRANT|nr:hypothetical protein SAY86_023630 [Trapa natans]
MEDSRLAVIGGQLQQAEQVVIWILSTVNNLRDPDMNFVCLGGKTHAKLLKDAYRVLGNCEKKLQDVWEELHAEMIRGVAMDDLASIIAQVGDALKSLKYSATLCQHYNTSVIGYVRKRIELLQIELNSLVVDYVMGIK